MSEASVPKKIVVNNHAVIELALHGNAARVKMLFRETSLTMEKLGLDTKGIRRPFRRPPGGFGNLPCLHDIKRWLDDIAVDDFHAEDVVFLKKLQKTLENRFAG